MTNTIKQTLNDRLEVVTQELATLAAEEKERIIERVKEEFQDAMKLVPEVTLDIFVSLRMVYFNFDGKEILSIQSKGGYGVLQEIPYYLNTYSTRIEGYSELKRLMFNGKVAEKLLADRETYSRIFAKVEEFEEKVSEFQKELIQLQHAVREIERKEASEAEEKAMFEKIEKAMLEKINKGLGIQK